MTDFGVLVNHAYALLNVKEVGDAFGDKTRLLQLRNPWGSALKPDPNPRRTLATRFRRSCRMLAYLPCWACSDPHVTRSRQRVAIPLLHVFRPPVARGSAGVGGALEG